MLHSKTAGQLAELSSALHTTPALQAAKQGVKRIRVHVLTDGRDCEDGSSVKLMTQLVKDCKEVSRGGCDAQVASGGGRMRVTMDRYEVSLLASLALAVLRDGCTIPRRALMLWAAMWGTVPAQQVSTQFSCWAGRSSMVGHQQPLPWHSVHWYHERLAAGRAPAFNRHLSADRMAEPARGRPERCTEAGHACSQTGTS